MLLPTLTPIHLPLRLSCSAPDYPQFMPEDAERYNNLAAVAVLTAPDWATPDMRQFAAAHPRPEAQPYYSLYVADSDEEWEPAASDASGMTDVQRPSASTVSDAGDSFQQQQQQEAAATVEVDSIASAGATATAAAEEDVSADTGVMEHGPAEAAPGAAAEPRGDAAVLPRIRVRDPSGSGGVGSKKENTPTANSPSAHKRSRKAAAAAAAAAAGLEGSEDTTAPAAVAVPVA